MEKYPYFIYPLIKALKDETDEKKLVKIRELIAVNVGDQEALRGIFADNYENFRNFYPDLRPVRTSTDDTIDSFIEKFGKPGMTSPDQPLLREEEAPSDYFSHIAAEKKAEEDAPKGNLTVEFAKILIKNGNYHKALEIIRDIYLNNPEKSIYFADQIRFIKKLMLNDERKKLKS